MTDKEIDERMTRAFEQLSDSFQTFANAMDKLGDAAQKFSEEVKKIREASEVVDDDFPA